MTGQVLLRLPHSPPGGGFVKLRVTAGSSQGDMLMTQQKTSASTSALSPFSRLLLLLILPPPVAAAITAAAEGTNSWPVFLDMA
ncbi:hypothetical protein TcWFU_004870 [Taenia crassiceps]|uniref:Uncharacterized protein n=1 Tax=Taenia crassiceps TaxID=6207 RepID=A0ABR4QD77_9CEST